MVDLLSNLRSQAGLPDSPTPTSSYGAVEDSGGGGAVGSVMEELMELHRIINPLLQDLKNVASKIKQGTKEAVLATSPEKERKIGNKITELVETGKQKIVECKGVLDQLKKIQIEEAADMTPAETQMCSTVITSSSNTFKRHLTEYLKSQEDYRSAVKQKVARQLRIAYPEAADSEIHELANEDPASVREAITQQMQKGGHATLQQTLTDLHEKYNDLKNLEDSVLELRDLFIYLSAIVEEQGEKLDSIEVHVENTREYTGQAVLQLDKAKEHKESYDRKRMWMYLLSSTVILIIVLCIASICAPLLGITNIFGCFGFGRSSNQNQAPVDQTNNNNMNQNNLNANNNLNNQNVNNMNQPGGVVNQGIHGNGGG